MSSRDANQSMVDGGYIAPTGEVQGLKDKIAALEAERDALRAGAAWIPVDERQPESVGRFLVTVDTDGGQEVHTLDFCKEKWWHEGEPTFCHSYYFNPTHWKPLPDAAIATKETNRD